MHYLSSTIGDDSSRIQSDRTLIDERTPSVADVEIYRASGMAIRHIDQVLTYEITWDLQEIDDWMRSLFPKAFEWLDARWGVPEAGELHWVLLQKSRQRLYILDRPQMTGDDLREAQRVPGRGWEDHTLRIGK